MRLFFASLAVLLCVSPFAPLAFAATPRPTFPVAGDPPGEIAAGPDGNLWFAAHRGRWRDITSARIGRVTPAGVITFYEVGSEPAQQPVAITAGPDGAMWFAERRDRVGRIGVDGTITEFVVADNETLGVSLTDIAAGPDGNLWATASRDVDYGGDTNGFVFRISPDGRSSAFRVAARPTAIAPGAGDAMWFTDNRSSANRVGRISTDGSLSFVETGAPTTAGQDAVTQGADAAMWFTLRGASAGRLAADGRVVQVPLTESAEALTPAPDGRIWFAGHFQIGSVAADGSDLAHVFDPSNAPAANFDGLAFGPDGYLWATSSDPRAAGIWRIDPRVRYAPPRRAAFPSAARVTASLDALLGERTRSARRLGDLTKPFSYLPPGRGRLALRVVAASDPARVLAVGVANARRDGSRIRIVMRRRVGPVTRPTRVYVVATFTDGDGAVRRRRVQLRLTPDKKA